MERLMHQHSIRPLFLGLAVILVGVHDARGSTADDKPLVAQAEDELALVGNAQFCCRFEVGRAWHGPEAALLKKVCQSHPMIPLWEGNGLEKTLGLQLTELERFVFFADEVAHLDRGVAIVATREPFNRDKVVTALVPNGKEVKVNDRAYVGGDKNGLAVVVRDKRSLAIGTSVGIEAFLSRNPGKPGELKEVLIPGPKSLMAMGMQPGTLLPAVQNAGKEAEPFVPLFQARSWLLVAEETDESLLLSFRLTFADDAKATKAKPGLAALVPPLEWYLGMAENQFPEFLKREAGKYPGAVDLTERMVGTIQALRAALKDFQIEQAGPIVRANLRVKSKTPATTLLMIFNLLPRAAKEP
jgi:hypothetical protein